MDLRKHLQTQQTNRFIMQGISQLQPDLCTAIMVMHATFPNRGLKEISQAGQQASRALAGCNFYDYLPFILIIILLQTNHSTIHSD